MSSTALSRPRNMLLDTETSTRIVNNERKIYAHEIDGMQREKKALLNGQPYNNAVLLGANIIMAGLFFYVTSLNADSVLPPEVAWAQPLVGGVSAIGAASLMYATNAIAYKLPTIRDRRSAFMMWTAWLAMLIISAITSAFIALLLVNGADSKIDTARMSMEQASKVAGVETASVATATRQLEQWITNGSDARTMRTRAIERRDAAQAILLEWRQDTLDEWGQGSKAANRRMAPTHPEHAPLIAAVNRAQNDVDSAQDDIRLSDARVEEWTTKLAEAERTQRVALNRSSDTTVTESSPWEETMSDMASMMAIFGLNFVDGSQFKATFAIFFAMVLTLAPPFWSFQTGASVAPEVNAQASRMAEIDDLASEARSNYRGGGARHPGGAGGLTPLPVSAPSPDGVPAAATSETASMGSMVDLAMGISDPDPKLPCGLTQSEYDKLYSLNYDKVLKLQQDAEGRLIAHTGEIALKKRYGGGDKVAKMLKHFLFVEGYGEYTADGSITLYNPAEAAA